MSETVLVALLSLLGTAIGSIAGIIASQRLTEFRLKQLEQKVEKHNQIVERTFKIEGAVTELQHDVNELKERLNHE